MAFWKKIFGSSDNISKGLDMIDRGVDMAIYTPEEKSIASQKILDWKLAWIKALGPQSKARRILTYIIAGIWCHHIILTTYLYVFAIILDNHNVQLAADKCLEILVKVISPAFLLATAFYYAANIVRAQK